MSGPVEVPAVTNASLTSTPSTSSALANALYERIRPRLEVTDRQRLVIGIAGESGSGKSSTADSLAQVCDGAGVTAIVLNSDDYFLLPPRTNHEHRLESLRHVGPHEVNLALLASHITAFRARANGVVLPKVDYPGNRFLTQRCDFAEADVLIVEGTYVLTLDSLDVRIFHVATYDENEERRRTRNRDIDAPIIEEILAIEHTIIAPQAAVADIVIDQQFRIMR